jgi:2,3-bisphosphoglycerate-dependent phosphoglycerate mutase
LRIYFIRHAQSNNNAMWLETHSSHGRHEDPALSTLGEAQAKRLAEFIHQVDSEDRDGKATGYPVRGFGLTHLYCSLMHRSVATAFAIAKSFGLTPEAYGRFCEYGGIFLKDEVTGQVVGKSGKPRSFFEHHYPGVMLSDEITEAGWWNKPQEPEFDFHARVKEACDFIIQRHQQSEDRVAIVSHGDFYQAFMAQMLGIPFDARIWFGIKNCGITRMDLVDGNLGLIYTNRVDYLGELLV